MYHSCPLHDNISDSSTDHSQVLHIDCDGPVTTEQTTEPTTEHAQTSDPTTTEQTPPQTIKFDPTSDTSGNDEYSSIKTTTSTQTTDSLQSTKMRTKYS